MSSKVLYRVAAVILVLYAAGHTMGFRRVDPAWNADGTVAAMKMTFQVQGQTRSYWDFFTGFGFFCTALLLFAALLAWQLSAPTAEQLRALNVIRWAFAVCFIGLTILTWRYFFPVPVILSALAALTLVLGAMR